MIGKKIKGPFSDHFYRRLQKDGIKPRRSTKSFLGTKPTFAVGNVKRPEDWKRHLHYNPQALVNLNHFLRLIPEEQERIFRAFELILEHEKTHVGHSEHSQAYPAGKIKEIQEKLEVDFPKEFWLVEQVANRGTLNRIMKDHKLKSLTSPRAVEVVSEELANYLATAAIHQGNFRRMLYDRTGAYDQKEGEKGQKQRAKILTIIWLQFPTLTSEILFETERKLTERMTSLVEKGKKRYSPRKK